MNNKLLKLSLKEKKILYLLRLNARMPVSEIARKIGCSRELTQYTLKNLIKKKKIVENFFIEIDYYKLGYQVTYVFIKLRNNSLAEIRRVTDQIKKMKWICWGATFFGGHDIIIEIVSKNICLFDETFSNLRKLIGDNIVECYSLNILEIRRFPIKFLLGDKDIKSLGKIPPKTIKKREFGTYNLSNEEKSILKELTKNPRLRIFNLALKLGFSYNKIKNHLDHLIKEKIILGFMTSFRFDRLKYAGLNTFDVLARFNEDKEHSKKMFEAYLENHKNISSLVKFTGGGYDYLFWIYAPHLNEVRKILDEMISIFPNNLVINQLLIFGAEEEPYWDYSKII